MIELGQWVNAARTMKGEIEVPVNAALAADAAFTRVLSATGTRTSCSSCHRDERTGTVPKAFTSAAFQPQSSQRVPLARLSALHDACTRDEDPSERCAMLHAVFDVGPVTEGAFESEVGFFP